MPRIRKNQPQPYEEMIGSAAVLYTAPFIREKKTPLKGRRQHSVRSKNGRGGSKKKTKTVPLP